jgi:membrane-associated phospholipid phosphatase
LSGAPRFLLVAAVSIAAALLLDGWAYHALAVEDVYGGDLGRMFRVMGFVPLWAAAALALALHDRGADAHRPDAKAHRPGAEARDPGAEARDPGAEARDPGARAWYHRGALLLAAPVGGGIGAEPLKLLLRRERPWAHDGEWVFRAFTERPFSTGGLALPSSHAMVAFAAAFMLARLFPRAAPVWWLLAAGCGLTRVMAGAHFVSDIVVAALGAWLVVAALWPRFGGPHLLDRARAPVTARPARRAA